MYRVVGCLSSQHDLRLVVVAVIICLISSVSAIQVWWCGLDAPAGARKLWTLLAGFASGFGVWATHFIAMLAYAPGLPIGYDLPLVIMSLVIAVVFISAGLSVGADGRQGDALAGGTIIGFSIAAMHYLGVQALSLPGQIAWEPGLIGASLAIGIATATAALWVASRGRSIATLLLAGCLLALAVVGLHFTGMGAMIVIPDPTRGVSGLLLSPQEMALTISAVAAVLLSLGIAAVVARTRHAPKGAGH
jgi:NO-binding membrane sensor protein with MHYT domain